jgi:hypothetical protein
MQLIDHSVFPSAAAPSVILPVEGIGTDYLAGSMYILRLKSGSRVGDFLRIINPKFVLSAGLGGISR